MTDDSNASAGALRAAWRDEAVAPSATIAAVSKAVKPRVTGRFYAALAVEPEETAEIAGDAARKTCIAATSANSAVSFLYGLQVLHEIGFLFRRQMQVE